MALSEKAMLRRLIRGRIAGLSADERARQSGLVVDRLRALLPPAGLVAAYMALPDEIELGPLVDQLAQAGRLALPRVEGDRLRLVIPAGLDDLRPGPLQIREPAVGAEVQPADLAAVLVPGRAFTPAGWRLGRGAGHYDRLLSAAAGPSFGVCFDVQLVDHLPTDPWDRPVHHVLHGGPA